MFVGEFTCLLIYFGKTYLSKAKTEEDEEIPMSPGTKDANKVQLKTKINPLLLAIPASCDVMGSTCMFIALTQCAPSVYQMCRGVIVVITAFFSVVFLKRKQYMHHIVSLALIVAGVAIVGYVSVTASDDDKDKGDGAEASTTAFGVILLLVSQCFTGCLFISEEVFLSGYYLDPFLVVGLEGMWGSLIFAVLLPIF
jgi:drug/metabolite transporter (DMT)-like permease